jgi:FkbM family methyltransferase
MGFWRRQRRSIRRRLVRIRRGNRWFVTDYLGAEFLVRLDNIIGREIAFRSYERTRIENFIRLCKTMAPELLIDIGANCGIYTCILLKNALVPRAIAFEPDRDNAALLRTNLMINDLTERTVVHQAAVGSAAGRGSLLPGPPDNSGNSRIVDRHGGYAVDIVVCDSVISVSGKTLAIKIDVEEFECQTLEGMTQLLRNNRGIVQIETWHHEAAVTATMSDAGFSLINVMRPDFVFEKR